MGIKDDLAQPQSPDPGVERLPAITTNREDWHAPLAIARDRTFGQVMRCRRPMEAFEYPHIPLIDRRNWGEQKKNKMVDKRSRQEGL